MGKITRTGNSITVEMSVDELLASCVMLAPGACKGSTFAATVAADKVASTKLAAELPKIKRFKVQHISDKVVVTMDDVDMKT